MILVACFIALLVVSSSDAAIKGGPRILGSGLVQKPHIHVGKGGGSAALHHTEIVQDPLSGSPVVVEKVTPVGGVKGGGIKGAGLGAGSVQLAVSDGLFGQRSLYRVGQSQIPFGLLGLDYASYPTSLLTAPRGLRGIKGAGLGAGSVQLAVSDGLFGQRSLYRVGQSQIPFGLMGLDYASYPTSLLTAPRGLRRKTILSDNLSGLRPIGSTAIIADPSTAQFSVGDAQIKTSVFGARRPIYRTGISSVPYGLMGLDYYSYPNQLLSQRTLADDLGLGQTRILTGGSAFTAGDSQIQGPLIDNVGQEKVTIVETDHLGGAQRVTTVQKAVSPLGSIALGAPAAVKTTGGLKGGQILLSGARGLGGFRRVKSRPVIATIGSSGLGAPIGGFGQRQIAVTKSAPASIIQAPVAPVQIVQAAPAPIQVVQAPIRRRIITRRPGDVFLSQIARPRVVTLARPASVLAAPRIIAAPRVVAQAPIKTVAGPQILSQVQTDVGLGRSIFGNRAPQLIYVDGGRRFPGIDIIGGSRIGDPRLGYTQLPISTSGFATLGLSQASIEAGPTLLSPAASVLGLRKGGSLLSTIGKTSPTKVVTQEEVVGPAGDPQVITTITETDSNSLIPSKIGGLASGGALGLAGIGRTSPAKVVTQEEVVGPLGDTQVVTTVTETGSNQLVGSKIGGPVVAGPLGLTAVGAPTKTVTQEEVIGPAGDSQIVTTVTQSQPSKIGGLATGGLAGIGQGPIIQQEEVLSPINGLQTTSQISQVIQDPIETAIQETLNDNGLGQTVQSLIDPLGSGQTQVSIDDGLGGGVTQVKETLVTEPFTGEVTKVTEVTKSSGLGGGLAQQNIADSIVQESIPSGLGGLSRLSGYLPRMSFLSQYPYDAPDTGLLRSVVTSPIVQQQQEVEQILV